MKLRDLVTRAVALGATPGPPAIEAELAAAEHRVGVRFDAQYRELMSICSGLEGIGDASLYPADELGGSPRWLEWSKFLEIEYFENSSSFETRGDEMVDPTFHPPPADRTHVLIGQTDLIPSSLVCNFSTSDPDAPPGEIADCRYEPALHGDLVTTLTQLIERAEEFAAMRIADSTIEPAQHDRAEVYFQIDRLLNGISTQNRAVIRHALSSRWRHEFDQQPGQPGLTGMRKSVLWYGARPTITLTDFDLWGSSPHSVRGTVALPASHVPTSAEVVIGVVKENTLWRIDSWTWSV